MEFLKISGAPEAAFEKIADKLLNEYAIEANGFKYRITEIEFYWNAPGHEDNSTYKRVHGVDPKAGEWYFHYSGVDIALKDEMTGGYGGILLRAVYDFQNDEHFVGPLVCSMKLFSGTNAFVGGIPTRIIPYFFEKCEKQKSERIGLGKKQNEHLTQKLDYRFYIKP